MNSESHDHIIIIAAIAVVMYVSVAGNMVTGYGDAFSCVLQIMGIFLPLMQPPVSSNWTVLGQRKPVGIAEKAVRRMED